MQLEKEQVILNFRFTNEQTDKVTSQPSINPFDAKEKALKVCSKSPSNQLKPENADLN